MGLVRTFQGAQPGERDDDRPYTTVQFWEAPDADGLPGTFVLRDTQNLSPVDTDPSDPAQRDLTTEEGTLDEGWWRLVFVDADGDTDRTAPVAWPPVNTLVPTLEEIGAINLARTEDSRGNPQGTFTTATTPNAEVVRLLAQSAGDKVADRLGPSVSATFIDRARVISALYAAALVEGTAHEPREALMKLWTDTADNALDALAARIEEAGGGSEEGPADDDLLPLYSFPDVDPLPRYA